MFERKVWVPTDNHPGANDLNRIENGIADNAVVIERIKALPQLDKNAKAADIVAAYNALLDAVIGAQAEPPKTDESGDKGEGE